MQRRGGAQFLVAVEPFVLPRDHGPLDILGQVAGDEETQSFGLGMRLAAHAGSAPSSRWSADVAANVRTPSRSPGNEPLRTCVPSGPAQPR